MTVILSLQWMRKGLRTFSGWRETFFECFFFLKVLFEIASSSHRKKASVPFSCLKFFEQSLSLRTNGGNLVIDESRIIHIMKSRSSDICVCLLPQLEATAPAASTFYFAALLFQAGLEHELARRTYIRLPEWGTSA